MESCLRLLHEARLHTRINDVRIMYNSELTMISQFGKGRNRIRSNADVIVIQQTNEWRNGRPSFLAKLSFILAALAISE